MNLVPSSLLRSLLFVVLAGAGLQGFLMQSARADIPYDPDEVQRLKAFLQCASMEEGRINAEVLGVDVNNPATWNMVSWTDSDPWVEPPVPLTTQHILGFAYSRRSLGGSIDLSGFPYMQEVILDNDGGAVGKRGVFSSINIHNNPRLHSVYARYISAGSLSIGGNANLEGVILRVADVGVLSLDAPNLSSLETSTLGSVPIGLTRFPNLTSLALTEIGNLTTLDLTSHPKIAGLSLSYLGALQTILWGGKANLCSVDVDNCGSLPRLDVSGAPNLFSVSCTHDAALTELVIAGNPTLDRVYVEHNGAIESLSLDGLPKLDYVRCVTNPKLRQLTVHNDPLLRDLYCPENAIEALDVSGLSALKELIASYNQLTQLVAAGVQFTRLSVENNKLTEISANVGGHNVHLRAYEEGGYVGFWANPLIDAPTTINLNLWYEGLPAPYDTSFDHVVGTGLPSGNGWRSSFAITSDIDATFYFDARVDFMSYFERAEDNPIEPNVNLLNASFIAGNPIGTFPPPGTPDAYLPRKTGYTLGGWYTDAALTQRWNFEQDILRGRLILYPNWVPESTPLVVAIERQAPADKNTTATGVTWRVTFSKPMSGVDASDFVLTKTGTANGTISAVSAGNGVAIVVTVSDVTGSGTLRLDVKANGTGIVDGNGRPLSGGYTSGESYTVGMAGALAAFLQAHGVDPESAAGAPGADPDHDGVCNLIEMVLGGDPATPNHNLHPSAHTYTRNGALRFEYDFLGVTAAEAVCRLVVESSTDLIGWTAAVDGAAGVEHAALPSGDCTAHAVTFPATGVRLFVRLWVEPR